MSSKRSVAKAVNNGRSTASDKATEPVRRGSNRVALYSVLACLIFVGAWLSLSSAWKSTKRREAYLPQLEAEALRAPNDGPLLALLGARLAQARNPENEKQAAANLYRAIAAGEQKPVVWRTLAAAYAASGDVQQAVSVLQAAKHMVHGDTSEINDAVSRLRSLSARSSALDVAAAICPNGPDDLIRAYTQGSYLNGVVERWGKTHPSRSGFSTREQWVKDEPDNPEVQRLWGLALLQNRRIPEAASILEQAVNQDPKSTENHIALARAFESAGLMQHATSEYLQALKEDRNSLDAALGFGRAAQAGGLKYDREAFLRATQIDPKSVDAWIGLGRADLIHTEHLAEGIAAFSTAARLSPTRTDFLTDYADALRRNSRGADAEALLRRRLAATPNDPSAHYGLSCVLQDIDPTPARIAEAEAEARKALDASPHNGRVEQQLGTIQLRERKTAEAVSTLEQSVKDDPYSVSCHHTLARAYGLAGKPQVSAHIAARATKLYAVQQQIDVLVNLSDERFADPAYHRQLMALYEENGNKSEAEHEADILANVEKDPAAAQRRYRDLQSSLQDILATAPVTRSIKTSAAR